MQIVVNGKTEKLEEIKEKYTVAKLVSFYKVNPSSVIVELNESVVKRESWTNTYIKEGDVLELVHLVGGG